MRQFIAEMKTMIEMAKQNKYFNGNRKDNLILSNVLTRMLKIIRETYAVDYEKIEAIARTCGAAFCLSGAGPTLLCMTRDSNLSEKLRKKLKTERNWEILPLHVEFQGAHVIMEE